eukprot:contig_28835_g7093
MLCPPLSFNGTVYDIKNYSVTATSSAPDVLDVVRGGLDMTSTTAALASGVYGDACRNVSVVAAFDRFVGDTELAFTAEAPPVNTTAGGRGSVCSATVAFRVVGVTAYYAPQPPSVVLNWEGDEAGQVGSVDSLGTSDVLSASGSGSGGPGSSEPGVPGASESPGPPPPPSSALRSRQPSGRVIFSGVNADSAVIVRFASLEHAPIHENAVRVQLPHDGPIHVWQGVGSGLTGGRRLAATAPQPSDVALSEYPRDSPLLPFQSRNCRDAVSITILRSSRSLPHGCGLSLLNEGPTVTGDNAATLSFRISLYRTGPVGVHLLWEALTEGWDAVFGGEVYENFVPIIVTGAPPPAVVRIDAPPLLRRQGGEQVVLSLLNMGAAVNTRLV